MLPLRNCCDCQRLSFPSSISFLANRSSLTAPPLWRSAWTSAMASSKSSRLKRPLVIADCWKTDFDKVVGTRNARFFAYVQQLVPDQKPDDTPSRRSAPRSWQSELSILDAAACFQVS